MGNQKNISIDLDEDAIENGEVSVTEPVIKEHGVKPEEEIVDEDATADSRLPKRARPNSNGSVTLPLYEKVTVTSKKDNKVKERVFTELVFKRFNGADLRAIQATSDAKASIVAFSRSTGVLEAVMEKLFDKMDGVDIADGGRIIETFLTSGGGKTGR